MLGGPILMFNSIIEKITSMELKDQNNVIVIKFDTEKYSVEDCADLYRSISEHPKLQQFNIIGLPSGVDMEVDWIDSLIERLEGMKQ
jgi:hypothetical protein